MKTRENNTPEKQKLSSSKSPHETLEVNARDELGRSRVLAQPRISVEEIEVDEGTPTQRCDTAEREILKHHFLKIDAGKSNPVQSPKTTS